jgi:hypothetical protein
LHHNKRSNYETAVIFDFIHVYDKPGCNGTINESTGINEVRQTTIDSNAPAYTLNGTRAGSSTKGIIIQNGKKIIRK